MKKVQENDLTGDLSQAELVTLAVYLLGGDQRAVDTEDAAVKAHQLAPTRFSWRKYPEQVNLELVRVYLSDAKKTERGKLLAGSGRTGWRLTKAGLDWAQETARSVDRLNLSRGRAHLKSGSVDEARWRRERTRILASHAWAHWTSGDREPSPQDAAEVFRIDSYAVGDIREAKVTRQLALFSEDEEIRPFLMRMAELIEQL